MKRFFLILLLGAGLGCSDEFNPVSGYKDRLVVYSVLNSLSDTQYVRLYSTYNAPGHNPSNQTTDTGIPGATVRISGPSQTWTLRDTLLPRPNTGRYDTPILAYYSGQFRPERGKSYVLEVITPIGSAWSSTDVPATCYLYSPNVNVIQVPQNFAPTAEITGRSVLAPTTYAFFIRFLLDYQIAVPGGWEDHSIEIPLSLSRSDSLEVIEGEYPKLQKRGTNPDLNIVQPRADVITWSNAVYVRILQVLRQRYPAGVIRFLRARFVLYQTGKDFYDYASIANGFTDQNTIRTDEPDFTNLHGARGLFGAVAQDTTTYPVAETLGL